MRTLLPRGPALAATLGIVIGAGLSIGLRPLTPDQVRADTCAFALDRSGRPLGTLSRRCRWAVSSEIAGSASSILVAVEDKRFWRHPGVDGLALVSALIERRGASTLSMQVVRALELVPRERSLSRKLQEMVLALRLERAVSKQMVIEMYLNRVSFGRNVTGIATASSAYFGKMPLELTFAESALLVSLLPAPSTFDPRFNLVEACQRRDRLLAKLVSHGELGGEASLARDQPCVLARSSASAQPRFAPHALGLLRAESRTVATTLDLGVQASVEASMSAAEGSLRSLGLTQASVVVLDSRTAEVRALVGSLGFDGTRDGQINGALLPRQAGSALKPFLYVEALRNGFELDTLIDDSPAEFRESSRFFAPQNADGQFLGRITLRDALARSRNIPAVRLVQAISPARLSTVLTEFGLTPLRHGPDWYGLGMALGTAEVRLIELTGAYATLGRGCEHLSPSLLPVETIARRVADKASCEAVLEALRDEDARVRGFGPVARLGFKEPVALKSGTSTGARDLWLFAVTEKYTVGMWAGNFDMAEGHPAAAAMDALAPLARELLRDLGVR